MNMSATAPPVDLKSPETRQLAVAIFNATNAVSEVSPGMSAVFQSKLKNESE